MNWTIYPDSVFKAATFRNISIHKVHSYVLHTIKLCLRTNPGDRPPAKELAEKLKVVMNKRLEEYEDFGGIEEVYFNSFVMQ